MKLSRAQLLSVVLVTVLGLGGLGAVWWANTSRAEGPTVTVYKSATCGCCKRWVSYLRDEGFRVDAHNVRDLNAVKRRNGVPYEAASCHTALVDGYVVEGHVPAADIRRLLSEEPDVRGIAVPKMPVGSPGMEQGGRKDPYKVVTFGEGGVEGVWARYPASSPQ